MRPHQLDVENSSQLCSLRRSSSVSSGTAASAASMWCLRNWRHNEVESRPRVSAVPQGAGAAAEKAAAAAGDCGMRRSTPEGAASAGASCSCSSSHVPVRGALRALKGRVPPRQRGVACRSGAMQHGERRSAASPGRRLTQCGAAAALQASVDLSARAMDGSLPPNAALQTWSEPSILSHSAPHLSAGCTAWGRRIAGPAIQGGSGSGN